MMFSGTIWIPFGALFISILAPVLAGISEPVMVHLRDTAVLRCNSTCNGKLLWTFESNNECLEVITCVQGKCTEGDSFKRRATIMHGHTSLNIHPALYNDKGWYEGQCDSQSLCTVHLDVLVPTNVNASVQANITLPCYGHTEKQIADVAVNFMWKKDGQLFLEVKNGQTRYGSGFTQRASVLPLHYRDGDLSLFIPRVTLSDSGLYQCYYKTEELGHPGAVTLTVTAHRSTIERQTGDNLMLKLFSSESVTITFTSSDGAEMPVCSVKGNIATCDPEYSHRASVVNYSLVLSGLSSFDSGTYTVKDNMKNVISVCTLTVNGVAQKPYWMAVLLLIPLACIGLFCLWKYHRKVQNQPSPVEMIPLKEPASIGLSQEETGHDVEEQPDVPHAPVEESNSEIVTSEKQDTSVHGFD